MKASKPSKHILSLLIATMAMPIANADNIKLNQRSMQQQVQIPSNDTALAPVAAQPVLPLQTDTKPTSSLDAKALNPQPLPPASKPALNNKLAPVAKPFIAPVGIPQAPSSTMSKLPTMKPINNNSSTNGGLSPIKTIGEDAINKQKCNGKHCVLDVNNLPLSQVVFISNEAGATPNQYVIKGWGLSESGFKTDVLLVINDRDTLKLNVIKPSNTEIVVEVPSGISNIASGSANLKLITIQADLTQLPKCKFKNASRFDTISNSAIKDKPLASAVSLEKNFLINGSENPATWDFKPNSPSYLVRLNDFPIANSAELEFLKSKKKVPITTLLAASVGSFTFQLPDIYGVQAEEVILHVKTDLGTFHSKKTIFKPSMTRLPISTSLDALFEWRCITYCGDLSQSFNANGFGNSTYGGQNKYVGDWWPDKQADLAFRVSDGNGKKLNTAGGWSVAEFKLSETQQYAYSYDGIAGIAQGTCSKSEYKYGAFNYSFDPKTLTGNVSVPRLHGRVKCPGYEPRSLVKAAFVMHGSLIGPVGVPAFVD